jgi:hypothetical protein
MPTPDSWHEESKRILAREQKMDTPIYDPKCASPWCGKPRSSGSHAKDGVLRGHQHFFVDANAKE